MGLFFKKSSIYNVRMVITEEKILSNIDKVKRLINPDSKKQIIKLEDDVYFKDLMESITTYLVNYPNKKEFPFNVYKAAYGLVEFATNQFEENNKKIAELLDLREENIKQSYLLQDAYVTVTEKKPGWIEKVHSYEGKFSVDVAEALTVLANSPIKEKDEIENAKQMVKTKIKNLESNLFIEVDLDRIEDSSKALSFIGIEIAEALKSIPVPEDGDQKKKLNDDSKGGFFSIFKTKKEEKENQEELVNAEIKAEEKISNDANQNQNVDINSNNNLNNQNNQDFQNNINQNLEGQNQNFGNLNNGNLEYENVAKSFEINGGAKENFSNINYQNAGNVNANPVNNINFNTPNNQKVNMFGFDIIPNDKMERLEFAAPEIENADILNNNEEYKTFYNEENVNLSLNSNINTPNLNMQNQNRYFQNQDFNNTANLNEQNNVNGFVNYSNNNANLNFAGNENYQNFYNDTRKEVNEGFFKKMINKFKMSKFGRWLNYVLNIQVVLDYPEIPENTGQYKL